MALILPKHYHEDVKLQGEYKIQRVNYAKIARVIERHPTEYARILAELAPCINIEHRHGVCPHGINHDVREFEGDNNIVDTIRQSITSQLVGAAGMSLALTYIAAGTGATPTTVGMTQLQTEYYRTIPSSVAAPSATQLLAYWFLSTAVGNAGVDLQEWGILAGGATSNPAAPAGGMIARFLQAFTKNNLTTASGQYTLNIT